MIRAEIVADSVSPQGKRLTTFKLRYPRFVHAEFMTHRMVSRNASSSRAVPFEKKLKEARGNPLSFDDTTRAAPVFWGAEQKGMQTGSEVDDTTPVGFEMARDLYYMDKENDILRFVAEKTPLNLAKTVWMEAANAACNAATRMAKLGVHKSICNRIIEPFTHIDVVATATEWDNFFGLRLDAQAEPTMRAVAVAMWEAIKTSTPQLLEPGHWHLPFTSWAEDGKEYADYALHKGWVEGAPHGYEVAIRVSVARCARISYESFETGKRSSIEEDLKLYDRLLAAQPLHASPAEHQATPDKWVDKPREPYQDLPRKGWAHPEEHGNLVGWRQYRKMLVGESCAPLPEGYR